MASKAGGGHNLIVVDPIRTGMAALATIHLQVLPGTDGALALGILRLLIAEGLLDKNATDDAQGFEELEALVEPWDLARVSQETTVPSELIERAAKMMGQEGPTAIWDGLGIEHHRNGLQTVRAVAAIQGLLGGIEAPGGVNLFSKASPRWTSEPLAQLYRQTTQRPVPPVPAQKPIGYDQYPLYDVFNRQAQGNLYPQAILEGRPYPLRAVVFIGCNPLVTWAGGTRVREALGKLKLLVNVDPFLTATGEISDYVLPAATFVESSGPASESEFRSAVVREQGEAWPDWKIVFELAWALGLGEYFPWKSMKEAQAAPRVPWMADPARQPAPVPTTSSAEPPRYPTLSGKLELKSGLMERFGADPLPKRSISPLFSSS